jgi:hypothetical protein
MTIPHPTQVQKMGSISTAVVLVLGGFCEHNDQVHRLVDRLAARRTGQGQKRSRARQASTQNQRVLI